MATITILDEGRASEVEGDLEDERVILQVSSLEPALGFVRRPEGLCKGDLCIPVRPEAALEVDGGIDVTRLAAIVARPVALDAANRVAYFGAPSNHRADTLASLVAPDFQLPDLNGTLHSLSEHRGKKVILSAYASW